MANQSDADDAILQAKAQVDEWKAEFMKQWYGPQMKMAMRMLWDEQPEDFKAKLKEMSPELVKQFEASIQGG